MLDFDERSNMAELETGAAVISDTLSGAGLGGNILMLRVPQPQPDLVKREERRGLTGGTGTASVVVSVLTHLSSTCSVSRLNEFPRLTAEQEAPLHDPMAPIKRLRWDSVKPDPLVFGEQVIFPEQLIYIREIFFKNYFLYFLG